MIQTSLNQYSILVVTYFQSIHLLRVSQVNSSMMPPSIKQLTCCHVAGVRVSLGVLLSVYSLDSLRSLGAVIAMANGTLKSYGRLDASWGLQHDCNHTNQCCISCSTTLIHEHPYLVYIYIYICIYMYIYICTYMRIFVCTTHTCMYE